MAEANVSTAREVLDSPTYPKPDAVRAMFDTYKTPINIQRHCETVAKASVILARMLHDAGAEVDVGFTESLALAHDLFKHAVLSQLKEDPRFDAPKPTQDEIDMHQKLRQKYPGMKETQIAHDVFHDDYPLFAAAIQNEGYAGVPTTWEEKIVSYVDYITFSDRVIGLEPRLQDVEDRYHADDPENDAVWQREKERKRDIERQIFTLIGITPEDLMEMTNNG